MSTSATPEPEFTPYVPDGANIPEFTWAPIVTGTLLGIVFGASSIYLVLKVGLTVSASIPVAVLSMTLFRALGVFGMRRATILENNTAQTAGCAGESIAFGVGLIMPALLLLGFEIDVLRVMTVSILGGLLGILFMIPLRRAFIVKQHGKLKYPEGTACAEVLIAGEKGGVTGLMVLVGFALGFVYQFCVKGLVIFKEELARNLAFTTSAGKTVGLKGASASMEMNATLLGVGYIIGPRISSIMVAGGVLAYLVLTPTIAFFGENVNEPLLPAKSSIKAEKIDKNVESEKLALLTGAPAELLNKKAVDHGLIKNMDESSIRKNYILYIGAGAVAAGGIISMLKALPVIFGAVAGGLRDLRGGQGKGSGKRTERDMSMLVVVIGSLIIVGLLAALPQLGLGLTLTGFAGAFMIVFFGFLFVTVSSRLTGEIGSSSNPISGMTVATLLLTCLILVALDAADVLVIGKEIKLTALMIAGVVCIASSNGGSTAQALKTGHLLGATPKNQQYAILIGALASTAVIGYVLLQLNNAGTTYTKKELPAVVVDVKNLTATDHVHRGQYSSDTTEYRVLNIGENEDYLIGETKVAAGRYFVNEEGKIIYRADPAVNGSLKEDDEGKKETLKFDAPKTRLMQLIIDGVLDAKLPWDLVLIGVLIALTLELVGVPSLPFAVGVYLPLAASTPIFVGGMIRWLADKIGRRTEAQGDKSPGVLLGSGYIAGASIAVMIVAFFNFSDTIPAYLDLTKNAAVPQGFKDLLEKSGDWLTLGAFGLLALILLAVGMKKGKSD
ncbi:MAG: peptide transporter [Gemmataceae bacterium]|nr:peptide transporter [Gemmataceae bacterium]